MNVLSSSAIIKVLNSSEMRTEDKADDDGSGFLFSLPLGTSPTGRAASCAAFFEGLSAANYELLPEGLSPVQPLSCVLQE